MGPPVRLLSSVSPSEIVQYRTLRRSQEQILQGIFVADGEKVVRRLLNSSVAIVSFLLTREWYEKLLNTEPRFQECRSDAFLADRALLQQIVGYRLHQGIMAIGKVPDQVSLMALLQRRSAPFRIVALDGLMNSENVGVIVRNSAGLGVDGILVGETSSSPYLRRAVRNSMGAVFSLPVLHVENLATTLRALRDAGTRVIAAHGRATTGILDIDFRGNICIVFGNEESGVSPDVLGASSVHVAIPMHGQVDSLNVASAAAVFLYEADRQRRSGR